MKLSICIPSYKRPLVLKHTLEGLIQNLTPYFFDVNIAVGVLGEEDYDSMELVRDIYESDRDIRFDYWIYNENIGKAHCLNHLFTTFAHDSDYILTMDNDMYIKEPFLHIVEAAIYARPNTYWDFVGFGATNYFQHVLASNITMPRVDFGYDGKKYTYCYPLGIGGGMQLLTNQFITDHPFQSNGGGVYLGEDEYYSRITRNRGVVLYDTDWVEHNPFGHLYQEYEDIKHKRVESGQTVFQPGWDNEQ